MKTDIIVIAFVIGLFGLLGYYFWPKSPPTDKSSSPTDKSKYIGICLFDVDGTLTTGKQNHDVVQTCLDAGFAVGVSTAGSIYTPDDLSKRSWMPLNLYNFMKDHNFSTMNNVSHTNILEGSDNPSAYASIDKDTPHGISNAGWRKGFVLGQNAKQFGISNPNCMLMFDDDKGFLSGILAYNKDYNTVCSGDNCGGHLTVEVVKKAIQKCM